MLTRLKLQHSIGLILLLGTLFSAALVLIGGTLYLFQRGGEQLQSELMQTDVYQYSIKQIWTIASSLSPLGIIELGLLALVVTQILRVALLFFFYVAQRDYWFTTISAFILLILIYSFVWRT